MASDMRTAILGGVLLAASCHAPSGGEGVPPPSVDAAPAPSASQQNTTPAPSASQQDAAPPPPAPSGLPPVERACVRDEDCAVAMISASGEHTCCPACQTTAGTRRWYAGLRRRCGAHPPADCPPLACPMGPTRAVCSSGVCEAMWLGADGGPTLVLEEWRCLPALICYGWAGCAMIQGNAQNGWFVYGSDRAAVGESAAIDRACPMDAGCIEAARIHPPEVVCPATSVPPILPPPGFTCVKDGYQCRRVER